MGLFPAYMSPYILIGPSDITLGWRNLSTSHILDGNFGFKYFAWQVPAICVQGNYFYCPSGGFYTGAGLQMSCLIEETMPFSGGPLILPDLPLTLGYRFSSADSELFLQLQVFPVTTLVIKDITGHPRPSSPFNSLPLFSLNFGVGF
jgi:hypothetical protein